VKGATKGAPALVCLWLAAAPAVAQAPAAGSAAPGPSSSGLAASASAAPKIEASCVELVPEGAVRPEVQAHVEPMQALSGHAVYLVVTVSHGAGETLLPDGFVISGGGDAVSVLRQERWFLPDPKGGVATVVEGASEEARAAGTTVKSVARIPFVPLPKEYGRHAMVLPPIPIAVARANGQVMTLCTRPQQVIVEDPIANEVEPQVRPNPPPLPQLERWEALVTGATFLGALVPVVALLTALAVWWLRRPKPAPAKPQIPPWITAIAALDALRRSPLLAEARFDEYFDRVDHITRSYLGERYGFDGLESTSQEIRRALARVVPSILEPERIHRFLEETDFMKYAEVTPTEGDCLEAIDRAEAIVRATTPRPEPGAKPEAPRRAARKRKKEKAA
jgi:hypothetical protein